MTTTNTLRKLFKKLFNVDVEGNSATAVLDDALTKEISVGGSGDVLVVKGIMDDTIGNMVADATAIEILNAANDGKAIFLSPGAGQFVGTYEGDKISGAAFVFHDPDLKHRLFVIDEHGNIINVQSEVPPEVPPEENNDGK